MTSERQCRRLPSRFAVALAVLGLVSSPATAEPNLKLDDLSVESVRVQRAREAAGRLVALGLGRTRSSKRVDAQRIVCQKMQPAGSHITRVRCATNAAWARSGNATLASAFEGFATGAPWSPIPVMLVQATANTPYRARIADQLFLEFNLDVLTLAEEYAAADGMQVERLRRVLAEHRLAGLGAVAGGQVDELLRFSRAFMEIGRLARREGALASEAELVAALRQAGIAIEAYNAMIERLETDAQLRDRVALVQMTYELEF